MQNVVQAWSLSDQSSMQAIAEKMKGISSTLTLTITRTGDLHVQVNCWYLTSGHKLVNKYHH